MVQFHKIDNLTALKALDVDAKDVESKIKNKEEMLVLHAEEYLETFRFVKGAIDSVRALAKAWKAAAHTASEKNRENFNTAFMAFKNLACGAAQGAPEAPALCVAAAKELTKMSVLALCNQSDWPGAGNLLSTHHLVTHFALSGEAGKHIVQNIVNGQHCLVVDMLGCKYICCAIVRSVLLSHSD